MLPTKEKIVSMAQAIAKAEGFGPPQTLPTRIHNPGDLEIGDMGFGTQAGKTVFGTAEGGWAALEGQVHWMLTGNSRIYKLADTFLEVAQKNTGGDHPEAWAKTVSPPLGKQEN